MISPDSTRIYQLLVQYADSSLFRIFRSEIHVQSRLDRKQRVTSLRVRQFIGSGHGYPFHCKIA